MIEPYDTRFIKALHARITADLNKAYRDLGSGSQIIRDDASATGMNCAQYIGRIAGLEAAIGFIAEVNDEMSGKGDKRKKED